MTSDDQNECPLCMEPFEVDDTSFYPCTCGYQICRFCWHRLRIDGNGLCPACRKPYSDNPAHFEPLSEDEIIRIKKERRQKEVQKKQKLSENRRHLSDVRVVQKNLVFVVGLSQRLADIEVLKKIEYFGRFGKILKVVVNSSPSYAGTQTPSASAYVTYSRADEALRAIQTVNNIQIDSRVLKASLGTTKYCSHFLKGVQCPKTDCMYLHDLGEEAASFTKEEMSQGKHLEYESKLIENILHIPRNFQNISTDVGGGGGGAPAQSLNFTNGIIPASNTFGPPTTSTTPSSQTTTTTNTTHITNNTLNTQQQTQEKTEPRPRTKNKSTHSQNRHSKLIMPSNNNNNTNNQNNSHETNRPTLNNEPQQTNLSEQKQKSSPMTNGLNEESISVPAASAVSIEPSIDATEADSPNEATFVPNRISEIKIVEENLIEPEKEVVLMNAQRNEANSIDDLDAFNEKKVVQEEDLGFDPWGESTKALQDLMKIEKITSHEHLEQQQQQQAKIMVADVGMPGVAVASSLNGFPTSDELNSSYASRNFYQKLYLDSLQNTLANKFNLPMNLAALYNNHNFHHAFKNLSQQELIESSLYPNQQFQMGDMAELKPEPTPPPPPQPQSATANFGQDHFNPFLIKNNLPKNIVPPPGFSTNSAASYASPNSTTSSTSNSSSSSSAASSVNNSASTTPALNNNVFINNKTNLGELNNEELKESVGDEMGSQTNVPKSLQDTFRSVFPNANISFGYKPSANNGQVNKGFINNNSENSNGKSVQSYWPDDPAIVSLNDGTKNLAEKISLNEKNETYHHTNPMDLAATFMHAPNSLFMNTMKKASVEPSSALNASLLQMLYQQHYLAQFQHKQNENLKSIEDLLKGELSNLSLNGAAAASAAFRSNNNNNNNQNNYLNTNNEVNNFNSANNTFYIIDSNQNIQSAPVVTKPAFALLHPQLQQTQQQQQQMQQQQQQQQQFMQNFISNFSAATKNANNNN